MKFLDANVFIYAYYKPKRELNEQERRMKELAKEIITMINNSEEEVTTTVVHLSEIVNILKHGMPFRDLFTVLLDLFMLENVEIVGVTREEYFAATELGSELDLDPNDALAVQVMDETGIDIIYSFDQDFDNIRGVTRLPK